MWMLVNRTAYGADRNWVRDKLGAHHWLVAVKATFNIQPEGKLALADEQPPPSLEPEYHGDAGSSSLRVDSDLLAIKPGTDVVLDCCAHAPNGRAAPTVPVSLRIADVEKLLLVHGPRIYRRTLFGRLTTTRARPFTVQPISYEMAFGGIDRTHGDPRKHRIDGRNPVGRGFAVKSRNLDKQPAHAVEYPKGRVETIGPAGFGPIASFWSPRLERAGTYDEKWEKSKKPLLPDDYDERFALSAPDDQRPSQPLSGGETVTLTNLTPAGKLSFELPKVSLAFRTSIGKRIEKHRANLASVFVDAEVARLALTWQSSLRVPASEADHLDSTTIVEEG